MSTTTDRVHFYERQYLRAFDLVAEQTYHLEMRRRLNLALHLWGVVDGFDIAKGAVVPGAPEQFIISPGMSIDGFGREVVSTIAYALSEEDLRRNRIQAAGDYWLSVAYRRELITPPSAGYRLCNLADQFTRWHESFAFLITDTNPTPSTAVKITDPLSDDPEKHDWPVVLGKVRVASTAGTLAIDDAWLEGRTYVGSRTERLVSPVASLAATAAESKRPIRIEADGLAEKNFAIGEDVIVNKTKVKPPPAAATFPTENGNLKVGTDLFVRGEIYKYISATDEWLALKEHLRQFIPDVKVKQQTIVPTTPAVVTQPVTGVENVEIETALVASSQRQFTVALAAVTFKNKTHLTTWNNAIPPNNEWLIDVHFEAPATQVPGTKKWNFPVRWNIGPMSSSATVPVAVQQFTVSCIAVFLP